MTKEELEKATGQELIEQRDYCGVDGYYGDYLDDVNAEILKRFNRLAELEKENAELKDDNKIMADNYSKMEQKFYDNLTKAKEILKSLYFIIESRIDYKNNIGIADEMWRAKQFWKGE